MRFSTKGRYGVKAMFELAQNYGKGPVSLSIIAQRQGISENYLEHLMAVLRRSGLVKSVRGAQGGYILGRTPENITVGDIIRTLEGPISPVECVNENEPELCNRAESCVTRSIWAKVRDCVTNVLDSITLEQLLEEKSDNNICN